MAKVSGKLRNMLYQGDNGYTVALFRIKKVFDNELIDFLNKTITITGSFINPNTEDTYILEGEYIEHPRYGFQLKVNSYEKQAPTDEDALVEFLSSKLIKGCGEKTAKSIVEHFGSDAINIIKNNPERLYEIKGMSENKVNKIYSSISAYTNADDTLVYLKKLGFSISECSLIFNKYGDGVKEIIKDSFYSLLNLIDFNKLDHIYINNFNPKSDERALACIIESVKSLDISTGNTYHYKEDIYKYFINKFMFEVNSDVFNKYLNKLIKDEELIIDENKIYLKDSYEDENVIANKLYRISKNGIQDKISFSNLEQDIKVNNIIYNEEQRNAIKTALNNPITIISGGPGVGKTTIINAIVKSYMTFYKLTNMDALSKIALLAPTGRAAKKLASSTLMPAQTIHRFLKWNKETDDFQVNEYNPNMQNLVIVDEVSMLDNHLFASLLKGLTSNIKLVLVGDVFQLPSVGPGQILFDLINSDCFPFIILKQIYRQSENSYIPFLARDIKAKDISGDIFKRKDDYSFIEADVQNIKAMIKLICEKSKEKGISENDIQILAPMYKGENGIDNLNNIMQNFFNPKDDNKKEIVYGYVTYREHDKVLQQINNPDCNVFNGDIGYIEKIEKVTKDKITKDIITINFDGNYVEYNKEDLSMIKHAYAITIHKSQGSEFPHVIMPICYSYNKMLYNKLIYTGVSRAKRSLIIIGEKDSFINAINNNYSTNRQTGLKDKLMYNFKS